MGFGSYLRCVRNEKGITALELGKRVNTTGQYITQLEQGKLKAPNRKMTYSLAAALETNPSEMWSLAILERFEDWCKKEGIEPENAQTFLQAARYDKKMAIQKKGLF